MSCGVLGALPVPVRREVREGIGCSGALSQAWAAVEVRGSEVTAMKAFVFPVLVMVLVVVTIYAVLWAVDWIRE